MKVLIPKLSSEWLANKTYIKDLFSSLKLIIRLKFLIKFIYLVRCLPDVVLMLNITLSAQNVKYIFISTYKINDLHI